MCKETAWGTNEGDAGTVPETNYSTNMSFTVREGVKGVRICRMAPKVNHLLFVDGSVTVCKAGVN